MKIFAFLVFCVSIPLAGAVSIAEARGGWVASFHKNNNCNGAVYPGRVRSRGERGCSSVSGAMCLNGSGGGYKICAYHGSNCDGRSTRLGDSYTQNSAYIYHDGQYESIVSSPRELSCLAMVDWLW
ncbi:hypothetical protein BJX64DRAFT_288601 [Aspergillus heterothallicus]